jgi:AraC family transcriptional activator FtrA
VQPNALYVDEGSVITAAGSAAGLDMLLHVVRKDHGARIANQVAQRLVLPPHRDGGQAQYLPRPLAPEGEGRIGTLLAWVRANLHARHSVAAWAARVAVTPRTLQRQFQDTLGLSPQEWLIHERVGLAKELLEAPGQRMAQVVDRAGFGSEESLRRHFRRLVGVSPSAYQRQFSA